MKIGILADVHANLPALQKAIEKFEEENCDRIIHLGDLVGIGPYPKECLDLVATNDRVEFIMGNHDFWYANGLPDPIPKWMSPGEVKHQVWTREQIGEEYREWVRSWNFFLEKQFDDIRIDFRHYGLNTKKNWFKYIIKKPEAKDLDRLFKEVDADFVFYGHYHVASDIQGRCRYINPGSAGCYEMAQVRVLVMEIENNDFFIKKYSLPYDDVDLMNAFEERKVPERQFIREVFYRRD